MGCDKIRLKVPLFCSELMASKPKAIPNSGPRKLTKTVKEGKVPSLTVNSLRKRNEPSGSLGFIAAPMLEGGIERSHTR